MMYIHILKPSEVFINIVKVRFFANKHWGSSDFFIFKNASSLIEWIFGFVFWAFFFGIAFAVMSGGIVYIIFIWYDFIKKFYVAFKEWKKGK